MTGEIVNFGDGRKPSSADLVIGIMAAKASLPEHDPLHDVLDAMASLAHAIAESASLAGRPAQMITLEDEQLALLTHTLQVAAERGVRRYADRIASWRSLLIGAVGIAGLLVGGAVMHTLDTRAADAAMDAARIDVPSVFGSLPLGEAAAWAKLIRENPPIGKLMAAVKPYPADGGMAVSLPMWVVPPPKPLPATPEAR
jgi:hypothetical protein